MNKDKNKELEQMIKEDRNLTIPAGGKQVVMDAIQKAKKDKRRKHRKVFVGSFTAVAAVFGLLLLPNINQSIANAMGELPVVGGFFKVVTIRDYNEDDGVQSLDVKVPGIDFEALEQTDSQLDMTAEKVSEKIDTYIEQLVAQFTADSEAAGYRNLDVSYDVVTDTENWFTIRVTGVETQASGFEFVKYYHIDKKSGKQAELKDIVKEDVDYVSVISDEVARQMKEANESGEGSYILAAEDEFGEGFDKIKEDQNFYFDAAGNLVICFDEYEVAAGSMGAPQITLDKAVTEQVVKSGIKFN